MGRGRQGFEGTGIGQLPPRVPDGFGKDPSTAGRCGGVILPRPLMGNRAGREGLKRTGRISKGGMIETIIPGWPEYGHGRFAHLPNTSVSAANAS